MKVPGSKMASGQGVLGSSYKHTQKNIQKSSSSEPLAWMLEIWYVALPSGPLPSLSNEGSKFEDGLLPGGPKFKP